MKTLKPIMAVILTAFFAISTISCSDEEPIETYCDNFEYLELPDNTDFSNLTDYERHIVDQVFFRLSFDIDKDGSIIITTKNAKEINVSENLFEYYIQAIDKSNEFNRTYDLKHRKSLLTRNSGFDDPDKRTDCVMVAISNATGREYDQVKELMVSEFGPGIVDGVKGPQIEDAFALFNMTLFDKNTLSENSFFDKNYVVIYQPGDDSRQLHAVNGLKYSEGYIIESYDYQRDKKAYYPRGQIYAIYKY